MKATIALLIAAIGTTAFAAETSQPRNERFKAACESYRESCMEWVDALRSVGTDEKRKASLLKSLPSLERAAGYAAQVIVADPTDAISFDAMTWLLPYLDQAEVTAVLAEVTSPKKGDPAQKVDVVSLLVTHHVNNPKLVLAIRNIERQTPAVDKFLRSLMEKSASAEIRGVAAYWLAGFFLEVTENMELSSAHREAASAVAQSLLLKAASEKDAADVRIGKTRKLGPATANALQGLRVLGIGKPLSDVAGNTVAGPSARLSDYKGKVLVIDVWATWCPPCRALIPHLKEITAHYAKKPFALVGISADAEKETVVDFLEAKKLPWPQWWDGDDGPVAKALGVRFYPTLLLVDHKGIIRYKNVHDAEKLKELIAKLVAEAEADKAASVRPEGENR